MKGGDGGWSNDGATRSQVCILTKMIGLIIGTKYWHLNDTEVTVFEIHQN